MYAGNYSGYTPIGPSENTITVKPTQTLEYQEFQIFDDGWYRITPCYKLNWGVEGLQQYCVVAKRAISM